MRGKAWIGVIATAMSAVAQGGCAVDASPSSDAAGAALIGGARATAGQFPSTLKLGPSDCTGAKIGPRHILTAAHCVDDASGFAPDAAHQPGGYLVVTNAVDGSSDDRAVRIAKTWIHPSHRPRKEAGLAASDVADVAVIELDDTWYETLADIPAATIDITSLGEDAPIVIMGYGCEARGSTSQGPLKFHRTRVATEALRELDAVDVAAERSSSFFTRSESFTGEAGGCPGDSGGPVYRDGTNLVVGINGWSPADRLSTGHTRLDVASRFDIGSWLASLPGVTVQGVPSDHYVACTDREMLVCGAIAEAREAAGDAFGAPLGLPSHVVRPDGTTVWRQDFAKKRVTVEPAGHVTLIDRAEAQCEQIEAGSFCGATFGDDDPRSLYTCKDHVLEVRTTCAGRCGLGLDASGALSVGCQP